MKKFLLTFLLLIFALPAAAQDRDESVYERVMRTKTIRCGYVPYAPAIMIDPNTGKISGIIYEIIEKAADEIGMKIEWAEEVSYGTMQQTLLNDRVDMI